MPSKRTPERLTGRATLNERLAVEMAAGQTRVTVSRFVTAAAVEKANRVLGERGASDAGSGGESDRTE